MREQIVERVRERMQEKGISAILVSNVRNVGYLTGFTGSSGFLVLGEDRGAFLSDSRYDEQAREEVQGFPVSIYKNPTTTAEALAGLVRELGYDRLGFEAEHVTFATHRQWQEAMPEVTFVPVEGLIDPLRLVKTPEEIEKIRQACRLADACFDHVLRLIQPGVVEYDIALEIDFYIRRQGAKSAFETIAVSGERSARPHGTPSEKRLERGDFVTMDFGARLDGYCSDLTRTVVVQEASDRHREVYQAVLDAQLKALDAIRPGVPAKDVDAVAREVLRERGLDTYFGHGLGHGLGAEVHDVGRMSPSSDDILEVGQVWTVEPGVYIPGFGGVRIEDDVVVTDEGCEILTSSPKELLILPRE
ncbi:MAG: Xaa-Pro dipeptidase [Fimbriimonadales bacterium]|nr:MAG: Xaa-Pro dipeptidase [Fimbriimonadales bacterium]